MKTFLVGLLFCSQALGQLVLRPSTKYAADNVLEQTNSASILSNLTAPKYVDTLSDLATCGTDGPSLIATLGHTTAGDGGEGLFLRVAASTYSTNAVTVVNGVGCQWSRFVVGALPARAAGTGNWSTDAQACFDAGIRRVLVDRTNAVATSDVVIPAYGTLEIAPNLVLNVTNKTIQLAGDNATLDGNWSRIISDQSTDTNYAAILVRSNSGDVNMQMCTVRRLWLTGNGVAETPSDQEGYGIRVQGAKRFYIEDVNVNLFRNTSDTCVGIQLLADETYQNCNRGFLAGVNIGNCDIALEMRTEGPTYISGYHTVIGLKIDSEVKDIVLSADADAVAAGHGPGYNKVYGCFVQLSGTTTDTIEVNGGNNEFHYYVDGTGASGWKNIWLRGGTGNFFRTPTSSAVKVETGAGGLIFTASSIVPLGSGNATYQLNPHADLAGGNKDITVTIEAANTNTSAILRMIGHNNTGAQSPDWRLTSMGSSAAPNFMLGLGGTTWVTNYGRMRWLNSGGVNIMRNLVAPSTTMTTNEFTVYGTLDAAGDASTPFIKTATGSFPMVMLISTNASAPTTGLYDGALWISNAVQRFTYCGGAWIP